MRGSKDQAQEYRKIIYENFPQSRWAAEAYFFYYPYRDYLQGDRQAIQHLSEMKSKFPDSPFTLAALLFDWNEFKKRYQK